MVPLRVNVQHLAASGVAVSNHGETVAAKHTAASERLVNAQTGWQGVSAAALTVKTASWTETTTALLTRLFDHAQGLHAGAVTFTEGEATSSRQMQQVAAQGDAARSQALRRP